MGGSPFYDMCHAWVDLEAARIVRVHFLLLLVRTRSRYWAIKLGGSLLANLYCFRRKYMLVISAYEQRVTYYASVSLASVLERMISFYGGKLMI